MPKIVTAGFAQPGAEARHGSPPRTLSSPAAGKPSSGPRGRPEEPRRDRVPGRAPAAAPPRLAPRTQPPALAAAPAPPCPRLGAVPPPPRGPMAVRGWRPAAAAIAAARPGGGGPGGAPGPAPASEPAPEAGAGAAAPATAALYVHWPYCRKRCSYCNFNKYVVPAVDEAAVRACLVREARTLLRLSQVQSVTSVFFGGGTPSLASPGTIAAVLEAVAGVAHLPAGTEVTLEANPSSASTPRLAGFRAAGVNRLSVGVQSLDDAELRLLGREHTAAEARGAVEVARGLFPGRTSIDLIFGLPGQSRGAWARGLEAALGLCDDHVSLYQLTLERGTALAAQVWGGALPTPPQDLLADMYQTARTMLVAAGFRHYEVSNFARKGALSTHNLSYWRAEQYIGVGPGAHGRFVPRGEGGHSREARVQTLEPDNWMQEVQSRGHGTRRRVVLSPLEQLEELLALGLRTDEGVTRERWGCFSPQLSLEAVFGAPGEAKALQEQGWLILDSSGLRCTMKGLALLDSLLPDLLCQLQRCWAPPAMPEEGSCARLQHPEEEPIEGSGAGGKAVGHSGLAGAVSRNIQSQYR